MLEDYFSKIIIKKEYNSRQIGSTIDKYETDFPSLIGKSVAIFGLAEENLGAAVRQEFYELMSNAQIINKIVDLGDISKQGSTLETNTAITAVISNLLKENIVPILIALNLECGEPVYKAFQNIAETIEFSLISHKLPIADYEMLNRICTTKPNYLSNINALAFQAQYISAKALDVFESLNFGHYRLGSIKTNREDAELYLRNAGITLFDINSIKHSDAPGKNTKQPSGLTSEEACQLSRYAGMGELGKCFIISGLSPIQDQENLTATLCSHLIWFYLDGFNNRCADLPDQHKEFVKYRCDFSDDQVPILFLKSKKTERWWMQIEHPADPANEHKQITFPCSYNDYQIAANGETPQRYLDGLKKLT